jgi:transposase
MLVGPGQAGDSPMFDHLMSALTVGRRGRGIAAVIAEPDDQKANRRRRGRHGGRPLTLDTDAYKGRNVVERSFNLFKQWRGIATRYDKLAITYRGGVVLCAITIWLRQ